jgi:RNA polymerase subunit RPABC4/transcription elongation factor Spt4
MFIPKRYGESKKETCPFCGKPALTHNRQGVPVCIRHKSESMDALRCLCGDSLELRKGKWGPYFNCLRCGNVSFSKIMKGGVPITEPEKPEPRDTNPKTSVSSEKRVSTKGKAPGEIVITSDELDLYY